MDSRDKVIEEFRVLVAKQAAQIEKLTARIAELELELAKAKKDSTTSSKPPPERYSQTKALGDPKSVAKGAKLDMNALCESPCHQSESTKRLKTIEYEIEKAEQKRLGLTPTGDFTSIQHIELPMPANDIQGDFWQLAGTDSKNRTRTQ